MNAQIRPEPLSRRAKLIWLVVILAVITAITLLVWMAFTTPPMVPK